MKPKQKASRVDVRYQRQQFYDIVIFVIDRLCCWYGRVDSLHCTVAYSHIDLLCFGFFKMI